MATDKWIGNSSADWGASSANWSNGFPNSKSDVLINTATVLTVTYGGGDTFTVHSLVVGNDVFDMQGGSLVITTSASFAGGFIQTGGVLTAGPVKIGGAGTLNQMLGGTSEGHTKFTVDATLSLGGYTLGGGTVLDNSKTVNMTNGIALGDTTGVDATIDNAKGASFDVAGDFGIGQGAATATFINAGTFAKTGGTGTTGIGVNFIDTGTIIVDTQGTIDFGGPESSFAGAIKGSGTFEITAGQNTIAKGAAISTTAFTISGNTAVALDENLTYGHAFTLENSAVFTLAPTTTLTLSHTNDFANNATIDGSGTLVTEKGSNTTINFFILGGSDIWLNSGTVGEVGTLTLGDNSFNAVTFTNEKGAVFEFQSDSGIGVGAAFDSRFVNQGTLEKTAGSNTSVISAPVTDTGVIKVLSGAIDFVGFENSFAGTISGAGTFEIGAGFDTIAKGTTITTSVFDIVNGAAVSLAGNLAYKGTFNFEAGLADLDLGGFTLTLSGSDTFNTVVFDGAGTLATTGAVSLTSVTLGGSLFWDNSGTISEFNTLQIGDGSNDTAHFINEKGGVLNFATDIGIALGAMPNSSFLNSVGATVAKTGGSGDSQIFVEFTNNGLVKVDTGTIEFRNLVGGTGTFTIEPGTLLQFDAAVAKGSTVDFAKTSGGELLLVDSQGFGAKIKGFGGNNGTKIDLRDINFGSGAFTERYNAKTGVLTLFDGSHTATLDFVGKYTLKNFQASADGSGGTLIVDPGPRALLAFNH